MFPHDSCTRCLHGIGRGGEGEFYLTHELVLAEELPVNGYHGIYRRH